MGGNDLICVTGDTTSVYVQAGAGDDSIDTRAASSTTTVDLGTGVDRVTGGTGRELVQVLNDPAGDAGADVVDTGANRDVVEVGLGVGAAGPDLIDLGAGGDRLVTSGPTPEAQFEGGSGDDTLTYEDRLGEANWLFDNGRGVATSDNQPIASWSGFDDFNLQLGGGTLGFLGSAGPDSVDLNFGGRIDGRLGGGADRVGGLGHFAAGDTIDGGAGRDEVRVSGESSGATLHVDLARGFARSSRGGSTSLMRFHGFEDAAASLAKYVTVIGTRGRNRLEASGDVIRLYGRGGNDDLTGDMGADRLVGGPGRDTADGKGGRDLCLAEIRHRCEGP